MDDWGTLSHYYGVTSETFAAQNNVSPNSPTAIAQAGPAPGGSPGTINSFTNWKQSPVFWLAVFAVFALGMIHLEGAVGARFGR